MELVQSAVRYSGHRNHDKESKNVLLVQSAVRYSGHRNFEVVDMTVSPLKFKAQSDIQDIETTRIALDTPTRQFKAQSDIQDIETTKVHTHQRSCQCSKQSLIFRT